MNELIKHHSPVVKQCLCDYAGFLRMALFVKQKLVCLFFFFFICCKQETHAMCYNEEMKSCDGIKVNNFYSIFWTR